MAPGLQNNISRDVAADSESVSFAGLLSVQDMQAQSQVNNRNPINKQGQPGYNIPSSVSLYSNKSHPSTTSIHNGQQQLQKFLSQPNKLEAAHKTVPKGTANRRKKSSDESNNETVDSITSHNKEQNQEKGVAKNSKLGQKMQSFTFPCRDCRVCEPAVKEVSIPKGRTRLH